MSDRGCITFPSPWPRGHNFPRGNLSLPAGATQGNNFKWNMIPSRRVVVKIPISLKFVTVAPRHKHINKWRAGGRRWPCVTVRRGNNGYVKNGDRITKVVSEAGIAIQSAPVRPFPSASYVERVTWSLAQLKNHDNE